MTSSLAAPAWCRGSKFCGFMDRKKAPKKDVTTADRVEDRLDMMRRRSS